MTYVVGAFGVSGYVAQSIDLDTLKSLNPYLFLASTLKLYVYPAYKPV